MEHDREQQERWGGGAGHDDSGPGPYRGYGPGVGGDSGRWPRRHYGSPYGGDCGLEREPVRPDDSPAEDEFVQARGPGERWGRSGGRVSPGGP